MEKKELHNEELHNLYASPNTIKVIKHRGWDCRGKRQVRTGFQRYKKRKQSLGRSRSRREGINRIWGLEGYIHLIQDRVKLRTPVTTVMNPRLPYNAGNFMISWGTVSFSTTAKQSYITQLPVWAVLQKVSRSSMRYKTEWTGNKHSRTKLSATFLFLSSTSVSNIFHLLEVVYITFQSTPSGREIFYEGGGSFITDFAVLGWRKCAIVLLPKTNHVRLQPLNRNDASNTVLC